MANYKNYASLLSALQREMSIAMHNVEQRSHMKALENADEFYSQGEPQRYDRTGKYGDAPDSTGVIGNGNHLSAEIFMNPAGHGYTTGSFSVQEVWQAAEDHTAGVLGMSGRWAQTESDIERIISEEFNSRFK